MFDLAKKPDFLAAALTSVTGVTIVPPSDVRVTKDTPKLGMDQIQSSILKQWSFEEADLTELGITIDDSSDLSEINIVIGEDEELEPESLYVDLNHHTVGNLRVLLEKNLQISRHQQQLSFNGIALDQEDAKLKDLGISLGSNVKVDKIVGGQMCQIFVKYNGKNIYCFGSQS